MLRNCKGFLLLEGMVAMFIVTSAILFTMGGLVFMLNDEKKCQEELEMAIFLYEMSRATQTKQENHPRIIQKGNDNGIEVKQWKENQLEIEKGKLNIAIEQK